MHGQTRIKFILQRNKIGIELSICRTSCKK